MSVVDKDAGAAVCSNALAYLFNERLTRRRNLENCVFFRIRQVSRLNQERGCYKCQFAIGVEPDTPLPPTGFRPHQLAGGYGVEKFVADDE